MNRPRKLNRGLPRRVYIKHGAYYFLPPAPLRNPWTDTVQTWIRLCSVKDGVAMMFSKMGELLEDKKLVEGTMPNLCSGWKNDRLGKYSDETKKEYGRMADVIALAFDEYTVAGVTTKDIADFLSDNFKDKVNTAGKYAGILSKMFRMAISKGLRQDNPCSQLDMSDYQRERREILPTHAAIKAIREAAMTGLDGLPTESGPMFQCIVDMSYLVWQRAIDIRRLLETQITDDAIRFKPSKTKRSSGKVVDVQITPQIKAVIERARAIKKKYGIISPFLFPTQKGGAYSKTGLHSMWRRAKARAKVTELIQFKDLRALGATDAAKAGEGRAQIQTRLAHTTGKTTEIYIKEAIPETSSIDVKLPW